MDGGQWTVILLIIGLAVAGGWYVLIWILRVAVPWVLAILPQRRSAPHAASHDAPRIVRRQPPARRVLRTSADLKAERRIILASLAAGVEPGAIARALRGSQRYNQRRVRELAARPAAAPQRRAEAAA